MLDGTLPVPPQSIPQLSNQGASNVSSGGGASATDLSSLTSASLLATSPDVSPATPGLAVLDSTISVVGAPGPAPVTTPAPASPNVLMASPALNTSTIDTVEGLVTVIDTPQNTDLVSEPAKSESAKIEVPAAETPTATLTLPDTTPNVVIPPAVPATTPNATLPVAPTLPDTAAPPSIPTQPVSPTPVPTPPQSSGSITQILLEKGALTASEAEQVELEQIQTGQPVESIIAEKKLVSEEALTKAKAVSNNLPFIKLEDVGVSPEALTVLPEGVARRYSMLPFVLNKQERTLSVAMREPQDLLAIDFAEQKSGYKILPYYAMPSELERLIAERYAQSLSSEVTQALRESGQSASEKKRLENLADLSGEVVKQAPITKIVETILAFAMKARASDVHIEPQEVRTRVRYRIDGLLVEKLILPASVHDAVVSRIKILSDLKIDEKRVPQDGRFTFNNGSDEVDLRVSTLPTIHGEKIVMRLLKKDTTVPSLVELGLRDLDLRKLDDSIRVPHGIILVTGPTGSGKTTTLYSVLHKINMPKVNIVTLEDPVEYQMPGVNQVQINPQAGLTFASGLRSFLRQDPNIIMVGEIRDSETVELAIQASLTGHLVFSTLHTSSAAGALPRLIDMGAEPFLLASSMTLTMAQRIVRLINPEYKEEYQPEAVVIDDIKKVLGDRFEVWCKQHSKDPTAVTLFRAKVDRPQTEPEYKGRIGIFEVMRMTEKISKMVLESKSAAELEKTATTEDGMLLMKQDGYLKALEGLTTIEEVLRVADV